jgi:hypothetical protein
VVTEKRRKTMAAPTTHPDAATREAKIAANERFVAFHSIKYQGYGVWEKRDDSYVWAKFNATKETAEALAKWLNATIPNEMHAWAVAEMLFPVSDLETVMRRRSTR